MMPPPSPPLLLHQTHVHATRGWLLKSRRSSRSAYLSTLPDESFLQDLGKGSPEALQLAKREIRRLKDAIKTLEACLKSKAPDTSAAWKSEAEKAGALLAGARKERDLAVRVSPHVDPLHPLHGPIFGPRFWMHRPLHSSTSIKSNGTRA